MLDMTTSLLVDCRICKHEFLVPEVKAGNRIACPHCRNEIEVVLEDARPPRQDRLVGREIAGCRLERRLGAGAMGFVYEATRLDDGLRVAVKMLSPKAAANEVLVKRFRREARLAATLEHPNVIRVYDFGYAKKVHYLVMEYVKGDTLARRIHEAGRLPWREAADHILQVGRGLARLADETIIHRDVKPANILVSDDAEAKLADLGLAKQEEAEGGMSLVTMAGAVMGSPSYMAPEQARDSAAVTHAADVYSLGATFYHAVTGRPPFTGRNAMQVMRQVLNEPATPPRELVPDLPSGVDGLIMLLMAKEPGRRPRTPSEAVTVIEAVIARPERLPAVGRGGRGRRRTVVLAAIVLVLLVVAVGLGLLALVCQAGG